MSQFESDALYFNALMADLAYVHLEQGRHYSQYNGDPNSGLIIDVLGGNQDARNRLKNRGWTDQQFDDFRLQYQIVDHLENTGTGLSITIFQDLDTGKRTVAFRGTEPPASSWESIGDAIPDLVRDLVLALGFSEATLGLGQAPVVRDFLHQNGLLEADGSANPAYAHDVNIVGHSLGGHLTLMAALDFPDLVNQAYTFNGAGLALLDAFYNLVLSPVFSAHSQAELANLDFRTVNVYAEPGFEATHSDLWFSYIGDNLPLFIEKQGGNFSIGNHSMSFMIDALSVHRLMSLLGQTLEVKALDDMLWQAANREIEKVIPETGLPDTANTDEAAISLNITMNHLATMLGGDEFGNLTTANDAALFYQRLVAAMASGQQFTLQPLSWRSDPVATAAIDPSAAGTALRYALLTGASFVVIPQDGYAEGIFESTETANTDYQVGQYSEQFWADRLDFYNRLMQRNQGDTNDGGNGIVSGAGNVQFYDFFTQQQIELGQANIHLRGSEASEYGNAINDPMVIFGSAGDDQGGTYQLSGRNSNDHIYGMAGDDRLEGNEGNDYLEGNSGMDTLIGGQGNDILLGGLGHDRYIISTDSGRDVIVNDNSGTIIFDGITLTGGARVPGTDGEWRSADGRFSYHAFPVDGGRTGLLITDTQSAATVRVEHWQEGSLGLQMTGWPQDMPSAPYLDATAPLVNGTVPSGPLLGRHNEVTGSVNGDIILTGNLSDWIDAGNGNDTVQAGDDRDMVNGDLGNDYIDGGAGDDYLIGGVNEGPAEWAFTDRDVLVGGTGRDLINGGIGDDLIHGEAKGQGISGGDIDILGLWWLEQGDWLLGGGGDDLVTGSRGYDMLNGGAGEDWIDGGDGDDILLGDGHYDFWAPPAPAVLNAVDAKTHQFNADGTVTSTPDSTIVTRLWNASLFTSNTHGLDFVFTPQLARNDSQLQRLVTGGGADELRGGIGNDWIAGQTGADTLWGGTGNDMLYGDDAQPMAAADEGDDTVYGDAGNDQLFGGGGNDRLYGGADNDLLTGDGVGQTGDDLLDGGAGNDTLRGGRG